MALFVEAVKGKKFKCDNCKKIFEGEKIKLEKSSENMLIENIMLAFLFVDKEGKIMGGNKGPNGKIGDQTAHCPLCNQPHLFGFDTV